MSDKPIPKINVVIRKRPLSRKELASNDVDICEVRMKNSVIVRELKQKVDLTKYIEEHTFAFDSSFDASVSNEELYYDTVKPLVSHAFNKSKVTCFAYGQTGSGKTHTMIGNESENGVVPGLYILAATDIFGFLEMPEYSKFTVLVSFYEIYCGKLYDLLNNRNKLQAREDANANVNIIGLQQYQVTSVEKLIEVINYGSTMRVTGVTGANFDSSRSHAILAINQMNQSNKVHGKVSFIDLAGNERGADTYDQDKQTRMDGAEINKSQLAQKECIRALDQDKKHTPFRGSKLTMVLKDSFIGNCKTVMIGCISPSFSCCEHTLNTQRYADRVKELKKPHVERDKGGQSNSLAKQLMLPRQGVNSVKVDLNSQILKDSQQNSSKEFHHMPNQLGKNQKSDFNPNAGQKRASTSHGGNSNGQNPATNNLIKNSGNFSNNSHKFTPSNNFGSNGQQQVNQSNNFNPQMNGGLGPMSHNFLNNNNTPSTNNTNINNSNATGLSNSIITTNNIGNQPTAQTYDRDDIFHHNGNLMDNSMPHSANVFTPKNNSNKKTANSKALQQQEVSDDSVSVLGEKMNLVKLDVNQLNQVHEKLISVILTEEEELIAKHREQLDKMCEYSRTEFTLLNDVERPGSDIDGYVESLSKMLEQKTNSILQLKKQLCLFKQHQREEQYLNNYCSENIKGIKDDSYNGINKYAGYDIEKPNFDDGLLPIEKENKNTLFQLSKVQ